MTRVLRLIARLNVGGPAQHVVWLSEALACEGFETLLATGGRSGLYAQMPLDGQAYAGFPRWYFWTAGKISVYSATPT